MGNFYIENIMNIDEIVNFISVINLTVLLIVFFVDPFSDRSMKILKGSILVGFMCMLTVIFNI